MLLGLFFRAADSAVGKAPLKSSAGAVVALDSAASLASLFLNPRRPLLITGSS